MIQFNPDMITAYFKRRDLHLAQLREPKAKPVRRREKQLNNKISESLLSALLAVEGVSKDDIMKTLKDGGLL